MPSIEKVKNWYVQSFQELIEFPGIAIPKLSQYAVQDKNEQNGHLNGWRLPQNKTNLNFESELQKLGKTDKLSIPLEKR
jgi:hypothetical protein